jgi:hypothetical protein
MHLYPSCYAKGNATYYDLPLVDLFDIIIHSISTNKVDLLTNKTSIIRATQYVVIRL